MEIPHVLLKMEQMGLTRMWRTRLLMLTRRCWSRKAYAKTSLV